MKKVLFATMVLAFTSGITLNSAQASAKAESGVSQAAETPVKPEELPDAVKAALSGETFKEWTISAAFLVKEESREYYKIVLTKNQEKQEVKLDKDGKTV